MPENGSMKPVMVRRVRKAWQHRGQQGSAALITTLAISAILIVLFVGITTIATREISQSINSDNASRALYAAEAGVEDAVRQLTSDPGFRENTCNEKSPGGPGTEVDVIDSSATGAANAPDTAWTCRTVTTTSSELTGRLQKDESLQLNLALGRSGPKDTDPFLQPDYFTLEWNDPAVDSKTPYQAEAESFLPGVPGSGTDIWNNRAAAIEVSATWLEAKQTGGVKQISNAFLSRGGLNVFPVRTVLASPVYPAAGDGRYDDFSPWNNAAYPAAPVNAAASVCNNDAACAAGSIGAGALQSNITAQCRNSPEYNCSVPYNFTGAAAPSTAYPIPTLLKTVMKDSGGNNVFINDTDAANYANRNVVMRFRPRYAATSYRIKFYHNSGGTLVPVYIPDGYATIDVTARSNNYFRRVVAKKQVTPQAYDGIFDNAMFSGKDICKTISVYRDFRGAPDYTISGGARTPNANAGKNNGCTES